MKFLLDTNVISELQRPRPDERVVAWFGTIADEDLCLSVITVGEITQGIEKVRATNDQKAQQLEAWLTGLRTRFADRILPIDVDIAERWGRLNAGALRAGHQPAFSDHVLAATALSRGLTLVTRNTRDFERAQVVLKNPWL